MLSVCRAETTVWPHPESAVREAAVNALVRRDYNAAGTDIMLAIYSHRLEMQRPGRLPNTTTPKTTPN